MTHDLAFERLPDLLFDRDDRDLLAHVGSCHRCQRQLFLLSRVDRLLRQRRPRARGHRRSLVALAVACVVAAAIALAVALPQRHATSPARFALRSGGGAIVARAEIRPGDGENESMAFVAKGLPARPTDTYLLWTEGPDNGEPVVVGRFMVSHAGECRARFNLPGTRRPGRFWITPSKEPAAIVAST
jgi:anti-sigma-K factor RskA